MSLRDLRRAKLGEGYAPVLTGISNEGATPVLLNAFYAISGQLVQVWGKMTIDPAVISTLTEVDVSLPFGQDIASVSDIMGTGYIEEATTLPLVILGETTLNLARLSGVVGSTAASNWHFQFAYLQG